MTTDRDLVKIKEDMLAAIQRAGAVLPSDRRELTDILRRPSVQRALHEVLIESDAQAAILLGINLENPEQRSQGVRAQGRALGMLRAVESLLDHIIVEDTTDE